MKTKSEIREEFLGYYEDLRDAQVADGCGVPSKSDEWEFFLGHHIAEGLVPASARNWPCPRK
jgi:hypothetical protein